MLILKVISIEIEMSKKSGDNWKAFIKERGAEIFSYPTHPVRALQSFRPTSYSCRQLGT